MTDTKKIKLAEPNTAGEYSINETGAQLCN